MKFVAASTMAAVAMSAPQDRGMSSMLQQQLEALANGDGFRNEISNAPGTTAFVATIGAGYGCWCFWGDDHTKRAAKGPPLDELDAFCHTLK